ncbi:hypothetical protein Y032_0014g2418 [Ancylostoma ceylanicum]|uniref:Uncharacterized protein n=1 Tax=Ancylostoma ceylanicum TaxID=53326 RepID=A0A016VAH8_9BILA|nr:hypothetical protein Y032_0014g2418 [Ancylostoma ceylanicum]
MLALVVCCGVALEFSAAGRRRQPERACRAPVSLPKNGAPRTVPLSTAVWSSLYMMETICSMKTPVSTNLKVKNDELVPNAEGNF